VSAFVDATLLQFAQDSFVIDLLNGLGLDAIFDASFTSSDITLQSIVLGSVTRRSYKIPAFESIRSSGTDERIVPDTQRVRKERVLARSGRLDWVDVAFDAVLDTKVQTLVAPLQSANVETLEQKLGGVSSIADLREKLLGLYPASVVDVLFARMRISTFSDFMQQRHLFVELIGAKPPVFDPNDPSVARSFTVHLQVKIADGFDVAGALQSAKLCRSILEQDAIPELGDGIERTTPFTFVTVFADAAVTDSSLPGLTANEAKTAVRALFNNERMFAQFIS
jgi:hypothetical protein